jgi:hypothetical protein
MTKEIPHGTCSAYARHGCRCDICRTAEVKRQREWRARKRAARLAAGETLDGTVPVRIRDVDYPSVKAAATALGVAPNTISSHLAKYGHADFVGLGRKGRSYPNVGGHSAKPVRVLGRDFPCIKDAARFFEVPYSTMLYAVHKGMSARLRDTLVGRLMSKDASAKKVAA